MNPKHSLLPLIVAASVAWTARGACESAEVEAKRHFAEALALLDRGSIDAAILEFEAAQRVRPHFAVLYNLGQAYGVASRPVEAADTLRRYLDEGGTRIDEQRRREVEATLRFYEGLIGSLVISAPPGSSVELDGAAVSTGTPVRVRAGHHGVTASLDGTVVASASTEVSAGKTTELTLVAREPPKLDAPAAQPSHADSRVKPFAPSGSDRSAPIAAHQATRHASSLRTWAFVSAGASVVAVGAAAGLFSYQSSQMADWRADRAALSFRLAQAPAGADDLRRAGELQQQAADIQRTGDLALGLAVVGGALVLVSVGLFLGAASGESVDATAIGPRGVSF